MRSADDKNAGRQVADRVYLLAPTRITCSLPVSLLLPLFLQVCVRVSMHTWTHTRVRVEGALCKAPTEERAHHLEHYQRRFEHLN